MYRYRDIYISNITNIVNMLTVKKLAPLARPGIRIPIKFYPFQTGFCTSTSTIHYPHFDYEKMNEIMKRVSKLEFEVEKLQQIVNTLNNANCKTTTNINGNPKQS